MAGTSVTLTSTEQATGMIPVAKAAAMHGVTPATVYTWIRRHDIRAFRIRGRLWVDDTDVARCEAARRRQPRGRRRGELNNPRVTLPRSGAV